MRGEWQGFKIYIVKNRDKNVCLVRYLIESNWPNFDALHSKVRYIVITSDYSKLESRVLNLEYFSTIPWFLIMADTMYHTIYIIISTYPIW